MNKSQAWGRLADHYKHHAAKVDDSASELASLVLADHCVHQALFDDYNGPTSEMVALAERIAGTSVDEMLAVELAKEGT